MTDLDYEVQPTTIEIRVAVKATGYKYDLVNVMKLSPQLSQPTGYAPDAFPENWGEKPTWRDEQVIHTRRLVRMAPAAGSVQINLRDWSRNAESKGWGKGWPSCTGVGLFGGTIIVTGPRSGVRWSWNRRLGPLVAILTAEMERRGFLMKPGQCGAYNCRAISGTNSPSNHSWANAGDLNWQDNPYTTTGRHTIPQWVYDLWARYGFANGSMYSGAKDWMHLEFMGSPLQADAMTALAIHEIKGGDGASLPVPIVPSAPGVIEWIMESNMPFPKALYMLDGTRGAAAERGRLHWYVMRAQAMLNCQNAKLVPRCPVDGEFRQSTKDAVIAVQKLNKINADGIIGPATLAWVMGNDAPDFIK